jgi:TonB family protein
VAPLFAEEAMKAKFTGTVKVSFVVGLDGKPDRMEVTQRLGLGQDEAVIAALREWRFEPGRKGGKAVPVEAELVATFRLRSFHASRLAYSSAPLSPPPAVWLKLSTFVGESCEAVSLGFLIEPSGVVSDFQVLSGTNESILALAQSEVRSWKFLQAKQEGIPVTRRAEVDFTCGTGPESAR